MRYSYYNDTILLAQKHGYDHPDDLIRTEYVVNKKTSTQVAEMIGKTPHTVTTHLESMGIKRRSRGGMNRIAKEPNLVERRKLNPWKIEYCCKGCGGKIKIGERYLDGGYYQKWHLKCR